MKALVIGGTGPTGPYIVNGLINRGYTVSIMHRGTHETKEIPDSVERIIGDPHFRETIKSTLDKRTFDLVIATYGRIRYIAEEMIGKTPRFIAIGGPPCYRGMMIPDANFPPGMSIPTPEDAQLVESEEEFRFSYLIRVTEEAVMKGHHEGHYTATMFRYPVIYGMRQLGGAWPVIRRIKDKRPYIVLPDGGLTIVSRGYSENMAHAVLLSVDQPEASAGQIYNCADDRQFTLSQWVMMIARFMNYELEIIGLPDPLSHSARDLIPFHCTSHHQMMDTLKIKSQLGYKDLKAPLEVLPRVVEWTASHSPPRKLASEEGLDDPLNYKAEDQLVAIYREYYERMRQVGHVHRKVIHAYPHPKKPGLKKDHRKR